MLKNKTHKGSKKRSAERSGNALNFMEVKTKRRNKKWQ